MVILLLNTFSLLKHCFAEYVNRVFLFVAVAKAWKVLENEEGYKKCMEIVEEAKGRTDQMVE